MKLFLKAFFNSYTFLSGLLYIVLAIASGYPMWLLYAVVPALLIAGIAMASIPMQKRIREAGSVKAAAIGEKVRRDRK